MFFKKKSSHLKKSLYYLITGIGIVIFWRGIWGLTDLYLYPDQPALSHVISLLAGMLILYLNDRSWSDMV